MAPAPIFSRGLSQAEQQTVRDLLNHTALALLTPATVHTGQTHAVLPAVSPEGVKGNEPLDDKDFKVGDL